jgi:hypothetical protein
MLTSRCPGSQRTRARARPRVKSGRWLEGEAAPMRQRGRLPRVRRPHERADQAGWQPLAGSRSPACAGQRPSTRLGSAVAKTHGTDGARRGVSGTVRQRERRVTKRCTCAVFDGLRGSSRSSCTTANPTVSRPSRRAWRGCPIAPAGSFNRETEASPPPRPWPTEAPHAMPTPRGRRSQAMSPPLTRTRRTTTDTTHISRQSKLQVCIAN